MSKQTLNPLIISRFASIVCPLKELKNCGSYKMCQANYSLPKDFIEEDKLNECVRKIAFKIDVEDIYNYNPDLVKIDTQYQSQYVKLYNPQNNHDNNLFVVKF